MVSPRSLIANIRRNETSSILGYGRIFEYGPQESQTHGAFRTISTTALLSHSVEIQVWEWSDLRYGHHGNKKHNYRSFVAISHVWHMRDPILERMEQNEDILTVQTDSQSMPQFRMSWEVLRTMAKLAKHASVDWICLDLLCMDEVNKPDPSFPSTDDFEKAYQISNMVNIYEWSDQVVIVVGGLGGIQDAEERSEYMNRAWTLECTLNRHDQTWVLIDWDYADKFKVTKSHIGPFNVDLYPVGDYNRIEFQTLLQLPRHLGRSNTDSDFPYNFRIRCLDGIEGGNVAKTAKSALIDYFSMYKKKRRGAKEGREVAIWQSMLLRTSGNTKDVIYSVQGMLGLEIDPYRNDRNVQQLFNDLALKTAVSGRPCWLSIGPVTGSKILRVPESRLLYEAPQFSDSNKTPFYMMNGKEICSGNLVGRENGYIRSYDIKFLTVSLPHIICAKVLRATNKSVPKAKMGEGRRRFIMSAKGVPKGRCVYTGTPSSYCLIVGLIGVYRKYSSYPYKGQTAIIFIKRKGHEWVHTGDGVFKLSKSKLPTQRYHLRMGKGSQSFKRWWKCDCTRKHGKKKLYSNYGIVLIRDFIPMDREREIIWVGYTGDKVPKRHRHWYNCTVWHNPSAPPQGFGDPNTPPIVSLILIRYVSRNSRNLPSYCSQLHWRSFVVAARINVEYSGGNFALQTVGGMLEQIDQRPESFTTQQAFRYQVAVEFSDEVAYLLMRKGASGDTPKAWELKAPAFYRRKDIYPSRKRWMKTAASGAYIATIEGWALDSDAGSAVSGKDFDQFDR